MMLLNQYFCSFSSKTPNAGVTRLDPPISVTAYKNHDFDPVLISGGDSLVFRAGEVTGGCGDRDHCPDKFCSSPSSGLLKGKSLGMYILPMVSYQYIYIYIYITKRIIPLIPSFLF